MAPSNPVHPYIPNSAPRIRREMLATLGLSDVSELFSEIPEHLRLTAPLDVPGPLSEAELARHIRGLLAQNSSCEDVLSFLGGGCWQHFVPAVCDEIAGRGEFLTAYTGDTYEDHGRWQALFEFASLLGEVLNMEAVSTPTYDWGQAVATSMRMAGRATGRREVLVPRHMSPERLSIIRSYLHPAMEVRMFDETASGQVTPESIRPLLHSGTAAVYFENPSYDGVIQVEAEAVALQAHRANALCLVGCDPLSLGVLAPPADYGADIVTGDLQPLGIRMQYGGGLAGFIATRDEPWLVMELPTRLVGITTTAVPGEYGFGEVAFSRTSFVERERGKEYVGTGTNLWGITAGVYLALLGPAGLRQLGEGIMRRTRYAMERIAGLPGVRVPRLAEPHFKEFMVCFQETGQTVASINRALRDKGIYGGHDLSRDFPEYGQCALYCVTEIHRQADIDRLVAALGEVTAQ